MTQQIINTGTAADKGNGDPLRTAFTKVNDNFTELYTLVGVASLTELAQDYAAEMFTEGTHVGVTVEYDDAANVINLTALGQTSSGNTAPVNPTEGALWWDSVSGRLYVYYGSIWVDASPVDGAGISSTNELVNGNHTVSLSSAGLTAFPAISNESLFIQAAELGSANTSIAISAKDSVIVTANILDTAKQWTFGTEGKLTLPAGTTYEYLSVLLTGHGDGLAVLDFALVTDGVDAQWIASSPNPEGVGYSVGDTFTFDEEFLGIPGASTTIEVLTIGEGGSIVELGFTQPPLYPADIYRDSPINLQVGAESNRWTFGATGNLTLPPGGDIKDSTGASVLGLDNLVASGNTLTHNGNADSGVRLSNEIAQMYVDNTTLYGFSENDSSWTSVSWTSDGNGGGVVQFSGISESFATFNSQLGNHSRKYMSINNIGETEITGWGTGDPVSYYVTQAPEPSPAPNDIFAVGFRIVYENRLIMDEDEGDFGIYLKNQNFKIEMYDGSVESYWQFGTDGDLTLPNNAVIRTDGSNVEVGNVTNFNVEAAGVVNIYTDTNGETPFQWQFGDDGNITLPAGGDVVDSTSVGQLAKRVEGLWTVTEGTNTYSFTVPADGTYTMWVKGNIPNGIITWNATLSISNTNVPAIGTQYAWNYTGGGSPILLTSIPDQIRGVAGTISTDATYAGTTSNRFDFGISNTSGSSQTIYYGWIKI